MFGRKKNNKVNNENQDFKTNNYQMTDTYITNNLVVGNLEYVSSNYTTSGPMVETTKQKYIFEKVVIDDKVKYREVFTGFIADTDTNYFDLPYIVHVQPIKEVIKTIAETVPKYGLLLAIDEINKLDNKKVKVMSKKKSRH